MRQSVVLRKLKLLLNEPIKHTNWYRNQLADRQLFFEEDGKTPLTNLDMVNIGSSNALFAFDYASADVFGRNWAARPQSLELGFKLLKAYSSTLKPNATVCIALGPFSGLYVPWAGKAEEEKYFGFLPSSLFDNYPGVAFKMETPLSHSPRTAIKRLIKDVPQKTEAHITQLNNAGEFSADAHRWIDIWKKQFHISDLDAPVPDCEMEGMQKRIRLMEDIVKFCTENKFRPVIVVPPVHRSLNTYFSPQFITSYLSPIISCGKRHGAQVIDMLQSSEFCDSDFADSFFLNREGASKFMRILIKHLN